MIDLPRSPQRLRHTLDWSVALHADPEDYLDAEPFLGVTLRLELLRRREKWAVALPVGFFAGNAMPGAVTPEKELQARLAALAKLREERGPKAFSPRDSVVRDGTVFYRVGAIKALMDFVHQPWLFRAMAKYIRAIEARPELVWQIYATTPKPHPIIAGHRARGVKWTEQEDSVVRQWFGRHADGKHHPLTERQWEMVLIRLPNRPKYSVKCRIRVLNQALKKSLMPSGRLTAADELIYRRQALGERVRVPRYRERELDSYFAAHPSDKKRRVRRKPSAASLVAPTTPPASADPWVDAFLDWNDR